MISPRRPRVFEAPPIEGGVSSLLNPRCEFYFAGVSKRQ